MKAPARITLAAICILGVVVAVVLGGSASPRTLVVSCKRATATATLTLSNSAGVAIHGWCEAPQIQSDGKWKAWSAAQYDREYFHLQPGGMTNLAVPLPQPGGGVRIPLAWGYDKSSALQTIAPRLHTRLSNLRITLRESGSVLGWGDSDGYLPDEHRFYYLTNAEPGGLSQ